MNWEAFGAIAELVAAAAVVISLLYVSLQLRAGRRELQTSTRDSVFRQLQEFNHVVMGDPDLADIFQRGSADMNALEPGEKARYTHTMYSFFKVFENMHLHYLDGSVPAELWEANMPMLVLYGTQPGGRQYWEQRRAAFDPRFVAVLEGLGSSSMPTALELSGRDQP